MRNRNQILFGGLAALLGILVPLLAGCGSGGGSGTPKATVQGVVEDSAKGDTGVGGATVTIGGQSAATSSATATLGQFTISNATIGAKTATVSVPGQAAQTIALDSPIVPGQNTGIVLIINIGQITGTVMLNGKPVPNVFVTEPTTGQFVQTASDGTFLLQDVPTGTTTTVLFTLGPASASQTVTVQNGLNDLGTINLTQSTNTNPPGLPSPTIQGTVKLAGASAGPAAGANVFLFRNGIQYGGATTTDASGHYGFYATPGGGYTVEAIASGYQAATSAAVAVGDPNQPTIVPDLTLQPNP